MLIVNEGPAGYVTYRRRYLENRTFAEVVAWGVEGEDKRELALLLERLRKLMIRQRVPEVVFFCLHRHYNYLKATHFEENLDYEISESVSENFRTGKEGILMTKRSSNFNELVVPRLKPKFYESSLNQLTKQQERIEYLRGLKVDTLLEARKQRQIENAKA